MSRKKEPLVYIIDKNHAYQKVIISCLSALDINNILIFDNGEQCYSTGNMDADIIILDYNLGNENWNGLEFMEEYSRINNNTTFIFLSSNTGVETAVKTIQKGALDYILKSKHGLVRLVKQIENTKQFHIKKQKDKVAKDILLGAIITVSTITALMSVLYTIE